MKVLFVCYANIVVCRWPKLYNHFTGTNDADSAGKLGLMKIYLMPLLLASMMKHVIILIVYAKLYFKYCYRYFLVSGVPNFNFMFYRITIWLLILQKKQQTPTWRKWAIMLFGGTERSWIHIKRIR